MPEQRRRTAQKKRQDWLDRTHRRNAQNAQNKNYKKYKYAQWWHSLTDVDPISLEPLSDLPHPPFSLANQRFDGIVLTHYILTTGCLLNPLSRVKLSRPDCLRLDRYVNKHLSMHTAALNHAGRAVTDLYDLQNKPGSAAAKTASDEPDTVADRMRVRRAEAATILQSLFYVDSRIQRRKQKTAQKQESTRKRNQVSMKLNDAVQGEHGMLMIDDDELFWPSAGGNLQEEGHENDADFPPLPARNCPPSTAGKSRWQMNHVAPSTPTNLKTNAAPMQPGCEPQDNAFCTPSVRWPKTLLTWAIKNPSLVRCIEQQLDNLLRPTQSHLNKCIQSANLKPMEASQRAHVHEMVTYYGGSRSVRSISYSDPGCKRYVSLVRQPEATPHDIPSPLLSVAAATPSPIAGDSNIVCVNSPELKSVCGDWTMLDFNETSDQCEEKENFEEKLQTNLDCSNRSRKWRHSRLCANREPIEAAPVTNKMLENRNRPKLKGASQSVKVSVYNRQDGDCVVSLPKNLVQTMSCWEGKTLWETLAEKPNMSTNVGLYGDTADDKNCLAAPAFHMWARSCDGCACLVQALPQSYLWI